MINGNWYYFKTDGYLAQNEFVHGWWCNKNGVQSDPVKYSWHKTSKGWWYGISGGWYAKNVTYTIDGKSYSFDNMGYLNKTTDEQSAFTGWLNTDIEGIFMYYGLNGSEDLNGVPYETPEIIRGIEQILLGE